MVRPPRRRRVGRAAETAADGNKMLGIGMPEIWEQFVGMPARQWKQSDHTIHVERVRPRVTHVI
jgi:hypothetical protein